MSHRPALFGRLAAILCVFTLVIAACATPSGSAPGATASPATPSPTAADPTLVLPSFETDVDLEARLPNELCGQPTVKFSFGGADIVADDEEFSALVAALGRSPADVSVASAGVQDGECAGIALIAFRIAGADSGRYEQLFIEAQTRDTGVAPTRTNVAGREVWSFTDSDGMATYLFFRGDIAYGVTASTEADAARGLAAMP